ncbi:MAG: carboxypeptidase-like regulatory domain-containing protein [Armatimonadota bacterium]|nr:carboxypeptidase-like regulatory domain-containing protein [Armatimonadota bacterium]
MRCKAAATALCWIALTAHALADDGSITGRVVDPSGHGVADAAVALYGCGPDEQPIAREQETDARGRYSFRGLAAGQYMIVAESVPRGYAARQALTVKLEAGQQRASADIHLVRGGVVEGTVTDAETGAPVPGAQVTAMGPAGPPSDIRFAAADQQGHYELQVPPGEYNLQAENWEGDFPYGNAQPSERVVTVAEGETVTAVDFALSPKPTLSGIVVNQSGQPVPNATVSVADYGSISYGHDLLGDVDIAQAQADNSGEFTLTLREGPPGGMQSDRAALARDEDAGLAGVVFFSDVTQSVTIAVRPGAWVHARVEDTEGEPLARIPVMVDVADPSRRWGAPGMVADDEIIPGSFLLLQARSDESGELEVGPLPAGHRLRVVPTPGVAEMALSREWQELGFYELTPGQTRELPTLVVNPAGRTIRGRVLDNAGSPQADVEVLASRCQEPVTTGPDGAFELSGLPARGEVWVVAYDLDAGKGIATSADPDFDPNLSVTLEPFGAAKGSLVDNTGLPGANRKVLLSGPSDLRAIGWPGDASVLWHETQTDADGHWAVQDLVGGLKYSVSSGGPDDSLTGFSEFVAEPGRTVDVGNIADILPPGGTAPPPLPRTPTPPSPPASPITRPLLIGILALAFLAVVVLVVGRLQGWV